MRCLDQLAQVQSSFEAAALQHVDHILGGHIACRRRGKRTAANAATAGIDDIDPAINGGRDIGERCATCVVEVHAQIDIRCFHAHALDPLADIPRVGHTNRVTQRQFADARALGLRGEIADQLDVDFAVERIPEGNRYRGGQGDASLKYERGNL